MSATQQLPPAGEISEFLTSLYGLKSAVTESAATAVGGISAFAEYTDAQGTVRGCIACDLSAAARLGAALTHIPMGAVEDTLEAGTLPSNLSENLAEVFNIVVNLFPECHSQRLVLGRTLFGDAAATAFAEHGSAPFSGFELDIQRYGKGLLLLAVP